MKKQTEELIFSPKIKKNYKQEINVTENVILNPNSYINFIERLKQMRNISSQQRNIDVIRSPRNSNRKYPTSVSNGKISLGRNKINRSQSSNTVRYKFINYLKNFNSINDRDSELLLKNNLNNVDLLKTNDLKDNFKTIKKLENVQELIN